MSAATSCESWSKDGARKTYRIGRVSRRRGVHLLVDQQMTGRRMSSARQAIDLSSV